MSREPSCPATLATVHGEVSNRAHRNILIKVITEAHENGLHAGNNSELLQSCFQREFFVTEAQHKFDGVRAKNRKARVNGNRRH